MVKSSPEYVEIIVDLTDEEHEFITAKAKTAGLDFETYMRFLGCTAGKLPDPALFLPLGRRIAAFVKEYEALLRAFADRPEALEQAEPLAMTFAQLLQDWDTDYGPR